MAIQKFTPGPLRQIYKNLYFDTDSRCYFFIDEDNRKQIVSQESYLLIYILEVLLNGNTNKNL